MKFQVYLLGTLAKHRRSRLMIQLLDAVAADQTGDDLPEHGLCLLFGKEYQKADAQKQLELREWCRYPGRTLLLIPPYTDGPIQRLDDGVDWLVTFCNQGIKGLKGSIAEQVAGEAVFCLQSKLPVFNREAGHQWQDYSYNTLFNKSHSASGVFAASTLPIWSISLMDFREELQHWMTLLHDNAGTFIAENKDATTSETEHVLLEDKDYTVLACVYAYGEVDPSALLKKISDQPFPLFSFDPEWLAASFERLRSLACIEQEGISRLGLSKLQEGPWFQYALKMKEESK